MGVVIGFLFRNRIRVQVFFAALMSAIYFAFVLWKFGDPDAWSWNSPIVSAIYQLSPYAILYFAPTWIPSAFINRWYCRRDTRT